MVRRRTRARKKRTVYPALNAAPAKRSGAWLMLVLGALVLVNLYVFVWDKKTSIGAIQKKASERTRPMMPRTSEATPTKTSSTGSAHHRANRRPESSAIPTGLC